MTTEVANVTGMEDILEFDHEAVHSIVKVVVPLFFGIIGILGFIGNLLVIVVIAANPGMRSTTNILIINLAVADLLFVIFCIPFTATDFVLLYWPFGNAWCKIVQYLIIVTAYASVYTLVLMSLDRYLAVVHPIDSMTWRTEKNALWAICIKWVVILLISMPAYVIHGEIPYVYQENDLSQNLTICRILDENDWTPFQVTFFLSGYVIPLALICIFYMFMLIKLWRGPRVGAESRRGRKRVTRLVFVVVGVFAICWCPIQMILVMKSLDKYPLTTTLVMIQIGSHILAYMNSCVNPFLYAFLSDNFRKAFRKIFYRRPRTEANNRLGPATRTTRAVSAGNVMQIERISFELVGIINNDCQASLRGPKTLNRSRCKFCGVATRRGQMKAEICRLNARWGAQINDEKVDQRRREEARNQRKDERKTKREIAEKQA